MAVVVMQQSQGDIGWCIYKRSKLIDEGFTKGDGSTAFVNSFYKAVLHVLSIISDKKSIVIYTPHVDVLEKERKLKDQTELYLEYKRSVKSRNVTFKRADKGDPRVAYAKRIVSDDRKRKAAIDSMPEYVAFTDGSCNNLSPYGEGGAAYVILRKGVGIVAQNSKGFIGTTNNRMELLAIISAINWLPDGKNMMIVTDSKYCINMLDHPKCTFRINKNEDLIRKYYRIKENKGKIFFEWVKGHSGDQYNEMVDSLADSRREEMRVAHNIPEYNIHNSPKCSKSK